MKNSQIKMWTPAILLPLLLVVALDRRVSVLYSAATPFNISETADIVREQEWELSFQLVENRGEVALIEGEVVLDYLYEEVLSNWASRTQGSYYRMWGAENSAYARQFSAYVQALNLSSAYLIGDRQ